MPAQRRRGTGWTLGVRGARAHNLQRIDVDVPLGTMTCVTGVSGSGKSTLVIDTLYRALARRLGVGRDEPGRARRARGLAAHRQGRSRSTRRRSAARRARTRRPTPALFGPIRELFAQLPEARARGYGPGRFSFNVKGGRCEACAGDGVIAHRDALPARRLRHLRGLRRPALRPRDARGPLQGPQHRRRPRPDRRGGARRPRQRSRRSASGSTRCARSGSTTSASASRRRRSRAARRSA